MPNHVCMNCKEPFYSQRKKVFSCPKYACRRAYLNRYQNARRKRIAEAAGVKEDGLTRKLNKYFEEKGWEDRYTGKRPSEDTSPFRSTLLDAGHLTAVPLVKSGLAL